MADHFETAWQDILLRTDANGGPTPRDLLVAMKALAEDDDEKHAENLEAVAQNMERLEGVQVEQQQAKEALELHCADAALYFTHTDELMRWRINAANDCEERMRRVAKEEHGKVHNEYVASLADRSFNDKLLWFFASNTGKLVFMLLGAGLVIVLNYLVYGRP